MRHITRQQTLGHLVGEGYRACTAQIVNQDIEAAVRHAIATCNPTDRRRAASHFMRAFGHAVSPLERDLDELVRTMFGTGPIRRLAAREANA